MNGEASAPVLGRRLTLPHYACAAPRSDGFARDHDEKRIRAVPATNAYAQKNLKEKVRKCKELEKRLFRHPVVRAVLTLCFLSL